MTTVSGAGELRLKESDRIESMEKFIQTLGGNIEVNPDGFKVTGLQELKSGQIKTFEDHRIAMTGVIANLAINSGIKPDKINCISDSYLVFSDLKKLEQIMKIRLGVIGWPLTKTFLQKYIKVFPRSQILILIIKNYQLKILL